MRSPDVRTTFAASKRAQERWGRIGWRRRCLFFAEFVDRLRELEDQFSEIMWNELCKPPKLARAEFEAAIRFAMLMVGEADRSHEYLLESAIAGRTIHVAREPHGVVAAITSYNTPIPNYMWKVAPALVGGNSVILKPSPFTADSAELFQTAWTDIAPKEFTSVLEVSFGGADIAGSLIEVVDAVSFTGSTIAGRHVLHLCASRNLPSIVEMGGNNPILVAADANLDLAVPAIVASAFSNGGQRCAAGSRLYIAESVAAEFSSRFNDAVRFELSKPKDESFFMPLPDHDSVERMENYLSKASFAGADISRFELSEWCDPSAMGLGRPALVKKLSPVDPLSLAELFMPVLRMWTASDDVTDALQHVNAAQHALTAAVWTESEPLARELVSAIRAGVININGPTHGAEAHMPFGGFGASGNGTRDAGLESLDYYTTTRAVSWFRRHE